MISGKYSDVMDVNL